MCTESPPLPHQVFHIHACCCTCTHTNIHNSNVPMYAHTQCSLKHLCAHTHTHTVKVTHCCHFLRSPNLIPTRYSCTLHTHVHAPTPSTAFVLVNVLLTNPMYESKNSRAHCFPLVSVGHTPLSLGGFVFVAEPTGAVGVCGAM